MRIKYILLIICFLWLTGCASLHPEQQPAPQLQPAQSWGTRVDTLSSVQNFDLNAVMAIHSDVKKNSSITANLQWQQQGPQRYTILLYGPLGAGASKLIGQPGHVTLQTADGKIYTAATPELLVAQQTDWVLPVSSLYYWIRGLPVPSLPATKQLDASNRLTNLQQQGWNIQFLSYTSVNQIDFPNKIFLYNPQLNVKIVIKTWKI